MQKEGKLKRSKNKQKRMENYPDEHEAKKSF